MIGIILLIGIVKKNGIMMVDFAINAERDDGLAPLEAIRQACLLRFRPILMTTMAALLSGLPLMLEHGAGSELRQPLGYAMVGGLLLSQVLTLYTTPVIYLYLDRLQHWLPPRRRAGCRGWPRRWERRSRGDAGRTARRQCSFTLGAGRCEIVLTTVRQNTRRAAVQRRLVHLVQRAIHQAGEHALDEHAAADQEAHQAADRAVFAERDQRAEIAVDGTAPAPGPSGAGRSGAPCATPSGAPPARAAARAVAVARRAGRPRSRRWRRHPGRAWSAASAAPRAG